MNREGVCWEGKKVTAMGLGRFGGQLAAIRFLAERGARVLVTDQADPATLHDSLQQLQDLPQIEFRWGPHAAEDFQQADLILVSPAVKPEHFCLQVAAAAGIPILTEIELFLQSYRGKVIAVTGTVGKSTTATMIAHIMKSAERAVEVGGNLGHSLLPAVDQFSPEQIVVLELSSFQLHWLKRNPPAFEVVVVTNFEPHHLEWHGTVEAYRECKQSLLLGQTKGGDAILPQALSDQPGWQGAGRIRSYSGTEKHILKDLPESWPAHWKTDASAAIEAANACGVDVVEAATALQHYEGLPHRLQNIGEVAGRIFINDSKATSPWATRAALLAMKQPTWLILGGARHGDDAESLLQTIVETSLLCGICGMGPAGESWIRILQQRITETASQKEHSSRQEVIQLCVVERLRAAFDWCWNHSAPGDAILMSPGCPSFNEFLHYEQRGHLFEQLMQQNRTENFRG